MKYLLIMMSVFVMNACSSQKTTTEKEDTAENSQDTTITNVQSETFVKLKMNSLTAFGDNMIKLKKVTSDSRCPEGTQCIWAGEAVVIVGIYNKGGFVKDLNVTFSPKATTERKPRLLFEDDNNTYLAYGLDPYPKEGVKIEPSQYELLVKIDPKK